MSSPGPSVTVILPTYNRATFLADAIASICAQTYTAWELLIVDDGSTDDTRNVVERLVAGIQQPVRYIRQENRGAYGARNTGLDHASGELIAFFDSDDVWLPHHLRRCVDAFIADPALDWVWAGCKMIDHATGRVIEQSSLYPGGQPRPFLRLKAIEAGDLRILDDKRTLEYQLRYGLYAGLQNSMIHRRVFDGRRFDEQYRVIEDILFLVRTLALGARVAYYRENHVIYRVHGDNSSASAHSGTNEKALAIFRELVTGYQQLATDLSLTAAERRALNKKIGGEYFWHLGYQGFWQTGRRTEALQAFRRGIAFYPWDPRFWKTYLLAVARTYASVPWSSAS